MRWAIACLVVVAGVASAQPRPPELDAIRVDERVGAQLPLELWFSDAEGRRLQLGALLDDRPTLLVLSYVRCRMLCSLVLRGAIDAVRALPLELGRDYRLVIVSIDPREEAASAAARTRELRTRADVTEGIHYLVGAERPIRALADSLGFRYSWDASTEQFAHPAVIFVVAPGGTITRYVHGVQFEPTELATALRGERGVAAWIGQQVLGCFRFDPAARAHREMIESYLQIGAIALMSVLGSSVLLLFWWERRRRRTP